MSDPSPKAKAKLSRRLLSSTMPGTDYGVFLMAVPIMGAIGVLITAFASYSLAGFIWLVILTTFCTAVMAMLEIVQAPAAWSSEPPLKRVLRWGALMLLAWPVAFPLYQRERKTLKLDDWFKAAVVMDMLFVAAAITAGIVTVTQYDKPPPSVALADQEPTLLTADPHWLPDADDVQIVKTGHLDNCPRKNLDQEVSGYFETPSWTAGATKGGVDFVNVTGILTYQDRPAVAVLQFIMYKDKSGFKPYLFTINNIPQPLYVTAFTLAQMCE
ncbi:MAG TPA: hypothetical protein VGM16_02675 [Gammaproteobacteria bacterium]|jgi:hypothetical protein